MPVWNSDLLKRVDINQRIRKFFYLKCSDQKFNAVEHCFKYLI